jgi:hypothetical protein
MRDIAIVVRDEVAAGDLERAGYDAAGDLGEHVASSTTSSAGRSRPVMRAWRWA